MKKKNDVWGLVLTISVGGISHRHSNLRLCRHIRANGACY